MGGQWEFSDKEMLETPSIKHGYSYKKEADTRLRACRIIERVGRKLSMPIDQVNMAKILLHRFYMRHPMQKAEYHEVSAALIFIASKLGAGGNFCKIEKIVYYCAMDAKKTDNVDMNENNKEFRYWYDAIIGFEQLILEKLCYDDYPDLPHPIALQTIRNFRVVAMEIVMMVEPRHMANVNDKVVKKLALKGYHQPITVSLNFTKSPLGVPGTPMISETSPLSNTSDGGHGKYRLPKSRSQRYQPYQRKGIHGH